MAEAGRWAVRVGAGLVAVLVLLAGYAWADAADVVPGPLTAQPPPPPLPAPVEPTVPAPPLPTSDLGGTTDGSETPAPPAPDPAALAAAVAPLLADPVLGTDPALSLRDLATGTELVQRSSRAPVEPASTAKLFTGAAALEVLGAQHRSPTRVLWLPGGSRPTGVPAFVLVGGGDLLLAAGAGDPTATVGRVGLADLARSAAAAVAEGGPDRRLLGPGPVPRVDVVVDDSLLGGPQGLARAPGDSFFGSAPTSLAVDSGRRGGGLGQDPDPALTAGRLFTAALREALPEALGAGAPAPGAPTVVVDPFGADGAVAVAEGWSAPLADVVAVMLVTSDNTVADGVAGLVALERGDPATQAAGGRAVVEVLAGLGVDVEGTRLVDGSGLSDGSVSSAAAMTSLLGVAAVAPPGSDLSLLPGLLPVAGVEGTVDERFGVSGAARQGRGVVRAKTGTLTGTTTLAGVLTTADGRGLAFAVLSDEVPAGGTEAARQVVDAVAAAVAGCC